MKVSRIIASVGCLVALIAAGSLAGCGTANNAHSSSSTAGSYAKNTTAVVNGVAYPIAFSSPSITTVSQCEAKFTSLASGTATAPSPSASGTILDKSGGADSAVAAVSYVSDQPLEDDCSMMSLASVQVTAYLLSGFHLPASAINQALSQAKPAGQKCKYSESIKGNNGTVQAQCASSSAGGSSSSTTKYWVVQTSTGKWFVSYYTPLSSNFS